MFLYYIGPETAPPSKNWCESLNDLNDQMTLMTHVLVFLMSHLYHITLQIPFPLKIVRIHPM